MEKKQRQPKRKFKEIYAEQKERIHNKEKLPKERKKRILAGTFAVLYIIISLFMILGKCNFVNASSESITNEIAYATIPFSGITFNTSNDPQYKQYDYPTTNIRGADTFYSSLNKPIGDTSEVMQVWECFFQSGKCTEWQIEEFSTMELDRVYTAYTGRAMLNTPDPVTTPDWTIFSGFSIMRTWRGVQIWGEVYGKNEELFTSWQGWISEYYQYFFITEFLTQENDNEFLGDGWDYIKVVASLDIYDVQISSTTGQQNDLEWKLESLTTDTSLNHSKHRIDIGNPNFLMSNNSIRFKLRAEDFVINNYMLNNNLLPYITIKQGNANMSIHISVNITYEYINKTTTDNGVTTIKTEVGAMGKTYNYNINSEETNTAYDQKVPLFLDIRTDIDWSTMKRAPQYYYIKAVECSVILDQITAETIPTILIDNYYGWSIANGTKAMMENYIMTEIGDIQIGSDEDTPIPQNSFLDWLGTALDGFFNTDIVGYFSLGDVLWIGVGFGLFFAILKMFAGG